MQLLKKFFEYISNPRKIGNVFMHYTSPLWPDKAYLKWRYYFLFGYMPDFNHPKTFNEKLNWLKLNYRNKNIAILADKYEVKEYVAKLIGSKYVVPNLGVYNSFDDIDFHNLPNQFVLKTTGDSSGVLICKDKSKFDFESARKHINKSLNRNYYYTYREWGYKNITPRIIADTLLDEHSGQELRDYKFWCFNGEPRVMYCTNKAACVFENFYDMDFNPLNINHGFERHVPEFEKPKEFELMKDLARKLSVGFPHVRVDFFDVNGHVYFGEFTFYDWGGLRPFSNYDWDLKIGSWLELPNAL